MTKNEFKMKTVRNNKMFNDSDINLPAEDKNDSCEGIKYMGINVLNCSFFWEVFRKDVMILASDLPRETLKFKYHDKIVLISTSLKGSNFFPRS
jgi:hypothetical protein